MSSSSDIAKALHGVRNNSGYLCRCPVAGHGKGRGDRSPSLSLSDGKSGLLVHCFAGCDARDVLAELRRRGLLDDRAPKPQRRPVAPASMKLIRRRWRFGKPPSGFPGRRTSRTVTSRSKRRLRCGFCRAPNIFRAACICRPWSPQSRRRIDESSPRSSPFSIRAALAKRKCRRPG